MAGVLAVISIYTVPGIKGYGIGTTDNPYRQQVASVAIFPDIHKIQAKVLPENIHVEEGFY